jgi:hypothetical protein
MEMCLNIVFVNLGDLYHFAMNLLTTLFSRHPKHREMVLRETILSLCKMEKKFHTFRLDSITISFFTSLVIQLLQSIAIPSDTIKRELHNEQVDKSTVLDLLNTQWEEIETCTKYFCTTLLKQCFEGENDSKNILIRFVDDLIVVMDNVCFPHSPYILACLVECLVENEKIKSIALSLVGKIASCSRVPREMQSALETIEYLHQKSDENAIYYNSCFWVVLNVSRNATAEFACDLLENVGRTNSQKKPLETRYSLPLHFENMLNFIIQALKDDKIVIRSQAMKSLLGIIESDSSVLEWPQVLVVIRERSLDESPKVRESIILDKVENKHSCINCNNPPIIFTGCTPF